jgi:hypothetical protein
MTVQYLEVWRQPNDGCRHVKDEVTLKVAEGQTF